MPVTTQQIILNGGFRIDGFRISIERDRAWIEYKQVILDGSGTPVETILRLVPKQTAINYILAHLPAPNTMFDQLEQMLMNQLPPEAEGTLIPNTGVDITAGV